MHFVIRQFALGMSVEIGAIAVEREHDQEFGVHSRRRNMGCGQAFDCCVESSAKLHESISPRRHRGKIEKTERPKGKLGIDGYIAV
jgi:hypothetical protein